MFNIMPPGLFSKLRNKPDGMMSPLHEYCRTGLGSFKENLPSWHEYGARQAGSIHLRERQKVEHFPLFEIDLFFPCRGKVCLAISGDPT